MTDFRFLHAADIHLDSPLHGLRPTRACWKVRSEALRGRRALWAEQGMAIYENAYGDEQDAAQRAKRGIWR